MALIALTGYKISCCLPETLAPSSQIHSPLPIPQRKGRRLSLPEHARSIPPRLPSTARSPRIHLPVPFLSLPPRVVAPPLHWPPPSSGSIGVAWGGPSRESRYYLLQPPIQFGNYSVLSPFLISLILLVASEI